MKHLRISPARGACRPRAGRMIRHRQHQANKLRSMADRLDGQILKLLRQKKRLLELADKLEAGCHAPVPLAGVRAVPDPSDWRWGDEG
jgi:hypothetical protein